MEYRILTDNRELYESMLLDIERAKSYVFLETYIFGQDRIGREFVDALTEKAASNTMVKLCVDGVGTRSNRGFYDKLTKEGGEIRVFRDWRWSYHLIKDNSHRNHRKLMIIDDNIVYIGSANITAASLHWRDLTLRLEGGIARVFKQVFLDNYNLHQKRLFKRSKHVKAVKFGDWEIIRDVPSFKYRIYRDRLLKLLRSAKQEVLIETPYFIPDRKIVRELKLTAKRGVKVSIVLPEKSDVRVADIIRERYFGALHRANVRIMFYSDRMLHSKVVMIDREQFIVGSANLDHRSLSLQFEISLLGRDPQVRDELFGLLKDALNKSKEFNYVKWNKRSLFQKALERILAPIRYLL